MGDRYFLASRVRGYSARVALGFIFLLERRGNFCLFSYLPRSRQPRDTGKVVRGVLKRDAHAICVHRYRTGLIVPMDLKLASEINECRLPRRGTMQPWYIYGRHGLYFFATYLYASETVRETALPILFRKRRNVLIILRLNLD